MAGRNHKNAKSNKNRSDFLFIKVFIAVVLVTTVSLCSIIIAFNMNSKEETYNGEDILSVEKLTTEKEEVKGVFDDATMNDNIFINNVKVGGLTKDEAEDLLKSKVSSDFDKEKLTFENEDKKYDITFDALNVRFDIASAINEAYAYTRSSDKSENDKIIKTLKKNKHNIDMSITYDTDRLLSELNKISEDINLPAVEPTFSRIDGEFSITKEEYGKTLNITETQSKAENLILKGEGGSVKLIIDEAAPKFTSADYSKATSLLGTFTSYYSAGAADRNTNISNAASKINDFVLMPGEIFSTNKVFGDMTYDNGYRMASTIVGGKLEDGIGGGVCQVSSTLYVALLYSELEIVERTNHSLKVGYMDWGFDATLAGNYIDLKFRNDTDYPVTIEAFTTATAITVNIYGHEIHDEGRKLVFENALIQTNPPAAEVVTEDPTLPLDERVQDIPARTGYVYNVYKLIYQNDTLIDKVVVNTSKYRATRGEVRVGTGPAAPVENPEENVESGLPEGSEENTGVLPEIPAGADPAAPPPDVSNTEPPEQIPVTPNIENEINDYPIIP